MSDTTNKIGRTGVAAPGPGEDFIRAFQGTCIGERDGRLQIEDQEGDVYDVEPGNFTPNEPESFKELSADLADLLGESHSNHGKTLETARDLSAVASNALAVASAVQRALSELVDSAIRALAMLDPESPAAGELISGLSKSNEAVRIHMESGGRG